MLPSVLYPAESGTFMERILKDNPDMRQLIQYLINTYPDIASQVETMKRYPTSYNKVYLGLRSTHLAIGMKKGLNSLDNVPTMLSSTGLDSVLEVFFFGKVTETGFGQRITKSRHSMSCYKALAGTALEDWNLDFLKGIQDIVATNLQINNDEDVIKHVPGHFYDWLHMLGLIYRDELPMPGEIEKLGATFAAFCKYGTLKDDSKRILDLAVKHRIGKSVEL